MSLQGCRTRITFNFLMVETTSHRDTSLLPSCFLSFPFSLHNSQTSDTTLYFLASKVKTSAYLPLLCTLYTVYPGLCSLLLNWHYSVMLMCVCVCAVWFCTDLPGSVPVKRNGESSKPGSDYAAASSNLKWSVPHRHRPATDTRFCLNTAIQSTWTWRTVYWFIGIG